MVTRLPPRRRPPPRSAASAASRRGPSPDPFTAVADPTRRAILDGLRASPRTAGSIAADFSISRPGVSKHLRILAGAGLVRVVKHGRERHYHLEAGPLEAIDGWVGRYRLLWSARLMALKDFVEGQAADADQGSTGAQGSDAGSRAVAGGSDHDAVRLKTDTTDTHPSREGV